VVEGRVPLFTSLQKKLFGGTNKLLAGKGMPAQESSPQIPGYWGGKRNTKMRAFNTPRLEGTPRLGGARPTYIGGRPFELAESDLSQGTALGNIIFFVAAMSMLSLAVFLSRRSSSASDQEPYFSAPCQA